MIHWFGHARQEKALAELWMPLSTAMEECRATETAAAQGWQDPKMWQTSFRG